MQHSQMKNILNEVVRGNEELEKKSSHFHGIEKEIDDMANKPDADIDKIKARAKVLIERLCGEVFADEKWNSIENKLEHNLRKLET